jgi:acetoin utilization protein AcuC
MSGLNLHAGDALARYGFGGGHPFSNDRFDAFWKECTARGLHRRAQIVSPVMADEAALLRFHTAEYVERVKHQSQTGTGFLDYGDTPAFVGVYEAAALVVGTTLDAVARVLRGPVTRAFVPIAGLHHARRNSAAGFCVFNDIGCAIEALRVVHGVRRIGYVDIDAHHGDGVLYSFEDDPDLIFADLHEDGRYLYPGTGFADETGAGAAAGTKLNIPMPPGADDAAFLKEWPRVEEFLHTGKPEIILLQAGADSIDGDPLTHLRYTQATHAHAATRLRVLAEELGHGRIVALGGGGYNRTNLARAWCAVAEALLD